MAFTDVQRKSLSAKLRHRFVKVRSANGAKLAYVEGWHVIAEANRIFGFDCWDRRTHAPRCIWSSEHPGQTSVLYSTTARIVVRAGTETVIREGIGTGFGRSNSAEAAHEIALKAAETDATKRALATFGNPFGLALYDKDQVGVTKPAKGNLPRPLDRANFSLVLPGGSKLAVGSSPASVRTMLQLIGELPTVNDLYAFWEDNRLCLRSIKDHGDEGAEVAERLVSALKSRARRLGAVSLAREPAPAQAALAFPKERRLRNKDHLRFVAEQPCLVCGRRPSHAHHVKYAQEGALGMKVSDEFTVPLCSVHHDALHKVGNERSWWVAQGIDPLKTAEELWRSTAGSGPEIVSGAASKRVGPPVGGDVTLEFHPG